jgi:hypothetical protein
MRIFVLFIFFLTFFVGGGVTATIIVHNHDLMTCYGVR